MSSADPPSQKPGPEGPPDEAAPAGGPDSSPPPAPGSMRGWAVRGAAVTTISQVGRSIIQIASVIILARLLSPNDYGLVAMVLAIVGVGEMFRDLGLSSAAIRAPSLSHAERDNLWWLNTGLGTGIGVLVALCAPLIAALYGREELVLIALAFAPSFVLTGMSTQYRVGLTRDLQFTKLAIVEFTVAFLALVVGVITAMIGWHYWALVTQQVFAGVVGLFMLWRTSGWTPGLYDRSVAVGHFVKLGMSFLLGSVLTYGYRNVDLVLIGNRYGTESLGLYTRSVQMVRTPLNQAIGPFTLVALPVLSKMGDDDVRLLEAGRRAQLALGYPVALGCALIAALSPQVVNVALGPEWAGTAPIMFWIAVGGGVSALTYSALWIFTSRAMAKPMATFNIVSASLALLGIGVGIFFGPVGVAAGTAASSILGFPVAFYMVHRGAKLAVRVIVVSSLRVAALATVCAVVARFVVDRMTTSDVIELSAGVGVFAVLFVVFTVLPAVRRDLADLKLMLGAIRQR